MDRRLTEAVILLLLEEASSEVVRSGGYVFRKCAERLYRGKGIGDTAALELAASADGTGWTCHNLATGELVPALC